MTEKSLVSINESVYYGSAEHNDLAIFWIEAHKFHMHSTRSLARSGVCAHSHKITATFTKFMRERESSHYHLYISATRIPCCIVYSFIHGFIHLFYRRMLTFAYHDFVHFHFDFDLICFEIWVTVDFYVLFLPFSLFFCAACVFFCFISCLCNARKHRL